MATSPQKPTLKTYREKRDFKNTPEPDGDISVKAARAPRFVVQKHVATRLHYDLRLEIGGVFKSWAVTRGPSRDPGDKRLAVETEDHPLSYGDFEGTIPKGEYGGGTMMIWDRGFWLPETPGDPEAAIKKGELKFVIDGEKLKGGYVLVRLRPRPGERDGRNNWLLIKHRDDFASDSDADALLDDDLSVASGRSIENIQTGKGRVKAFMTASTPVATSKRARTARKPTTKRRAT